MRFHSQQTRNSLFKKSLKPCAIDACRAWCYASLVPTKDMELVVQGASLGCPCFQALLHAALRALIDQLGAATFNVGIFNIRCGQGAWQKL